MQDMVTNKHTMKTSETVTVTCDTCKKSFKKLVEDGHTSAIKQAISSSDSEEHICYRCALERITKGNCPEEGDFNSAKIISGEMSDDERRWLMEDLRSVEAGSGRSREEEEMDDSCYRCGGSPCHCHEDYMDEERDRYEDEQAAKQAARLEEYENMLAANQE